MNISPSLFAAFIVLLVCIAWWRLRHLYLAFPVVLLVFPTTRTMLGPVPVYWYDATMLLLLLFLWLRRDLRALAAGNSPLALVVYLGRLCIWNPIAFTPLRRQPRDILDLRPRHTGMDGIPCRHGAAPSADASAAGVSA